MKSRLLQILYVNPFTGLDHEESYTHLTKFYEIVGTLGAHEAEEEKVFMRLFPHSLIGKAKEWYLDQPTQTMIGWNALEEKFLDRFFPHDIFMEDKTLIDVFSQGSSESLCEAWEWYKLMLKRCPNHGFDELTHTFIFHNGLQSQPKILLDAIAGGSVMSKSEKNVVDIIDIMAINNHQVPHGVHQQKLYQIQPDHHNRWPFQIPSSYSSKPWDYYPNCIPCVSLC